LYIWVAGYFSIWGYIEALIMEISFEALREAGVRLPQIVGPSPAEFCKKPIKWLAFCFFIWKEQRKGLSQSRKTPEKF
jgi:hypothetical protein